MSLTPYELERQAKLAENARLLESLGLVTFDEGPQRKKQRVSKAKVEQLPTRRSLPRRTGRERHLSDSPYTPGEDDENEEDEEEDENSFIDDEIVSEDDTRIRRAPKGPPRARNRSGRTKIVVKSGRVYDPVNGTSCHQCRQKTTDPKIACTNILTGWDGSRFNCTLMMCFRCLPNRYGQDVFSELKDEWQCPKCTGICNCSFCRKAKGKAPTGIMILKARALGFACVADMLAEMEGRSKKLRKGEVTKGEVTDEAIVEQLEIKDNPAATEMLIGKSLPVRMTKSASPEVALEAKLPEEEMLANGNTNLHSGDEEEGEDEVESIVEAKLHYGSRLLFRVRWRGFDATEDTYESLANVEELAALDDLLASGPTVEHKGRKIALRDLVHHEEAGTLRTYLKSLSSTSTSTSTSTAHNTPTKRVLDRKRRQSARF